MTKPALGLLIAGAVVGALVVVIGGIGGLLYFGARGFGTRPPTQEEKKLVVTTSQLGRYVAVDPKCERLNFKRNFDGTREIEAEYDSETCNTGFLAFNANAEISPSVRDARQSFTMQIGAYKVGARIGGVTVHEAPGLLTVGEQRYAARLQQGAKVVGNVFAVRQGRVVHGLFVVGLTFDSAEHSDALFAPLLAESARQFGGKRS